MKMKLITLILACTCTLPWTQAAVEPISLILGGTALNYTVPAGKVLVIEHAMATSSDGKLILRREFILDNGPAVPTFLNITLNNSYTDGTLYSLNRPLKIKAGSKIHRNQITPSSTTYLFGLLVDEADLFAAVPNEIEDGRVAAGVFSATVQASSARPARAVVEKSADAQTYVTDSSASVTRTDAGTLSVTSSTDDAIKLIRVDLRARPSE
ncbi:MAG: hypothetical protein VCG02_14980 [Verrucomicrobiota bacterium]